MCAHPPSRCALRRTGQRPSDPVRDLSGLVAHLVSAQGRMTDAIATQIGRPTIAISPAHAIRR